jgi:hypothetical protein
MLSLSFYKVAHLFGVMLMFSALGAVVAAAVAGDANPRLKRLGGMAHGIALLLIMVAGFGLIARQGFEGGWPLWVWIKLVIWLVFGAAAVMARKAGEKVGWLLLLLPALGGVSAWLALYRVGG